MAEAKSEREAAVKQRDRLVRMTDDKNEFVAKLQQARMSVYKVRQQARMSVYKVTLPSYMYIRRVQYVHLEFNTT